MGRPRRLDQAVECRAAGRQWSGPARLRYRLAGEHGYDELVPGRRLSGTSPGQQEDDGAGQEDSMAMALTYGAAVGTVQRERRPVESASHSSQPNAVPSRSLEECPVRWPPTACRWSWWVQVAGGLPHVAGSNVSWFLSPVHSGSADSRSFVASRSQSGVTRLARTATPSNTPRESPGSHRWPSAGGT